MSRSKHTDPRLIRATRRVQAPFEPRSTGNLSRRRELGRLFKALGVIPRHSDIAKPRNLHLRIITRPPNPGFHHPVGKNEVLGILKSLGFALYYLCGTRVGRMAVRGEPGNRRPEVLLLGPGNHVEVGSAIRSIAGFGWNRVFIEDRKQVWFGCVRAVRTEGRAAARRGKNEILCIPCPVETSHAFSRVTVLTARRTGTPVHRENLARGPSQLIVIPDESCVDCAAEEWRRLGKEVEFAQLQVPVAEFPYHYRLIATIALAEVSRQVGRRPTSKAPPPLRPPIYDHRLASVADEIDEPIHLDDLIDY